MRFNKFLLGLGAVGAMLATTASATLGFDTYKAARTYVLAPPENFVVGVNTVTNGPIDLLKTIGTAKIDFETVTNTGAASGTLTATLYGSPDQTNFTALSNFYLITAPTTQSITNGYFGSTNLIANNSVLLPYTNITTLATAWSAGYATPQPFYYPATNSGAITLNGNKTVQVGLNMDDQLRYLYVVYTVGGSATNFTSSALLTTIQFVQ